MTAAALPYILSGAATIGGTLLQNMAADKAANKQSAIVAESDRRSKKIGAANRALALNEAQNYDPTKRAEAQGKIEDTISQGLTTTLADNNQVSTPNEGKVSADFNTDQAKADLGRHQNAVNLTRLFSKMRAPGQLRLDEGMRNADVASQIGENAGNAAEYQGAGQIDASNVHPNQGLMLLGGLSNALGSAKLLSLAQGAKAAVPGYSTNPIQGAQVFLQK